MNVKKSEFWFDLPQEQIAQTPMEPRDHSRLLVMDRQSGACSHHHFYDIIDYLNPGDLLVVNDSRVIPARLYGIKPDTGGHIEVLLLEQKEKDVWEALVKPGKKAKPGVKLTFGDGLMTGEVLETVEGGNRLIRFSYEGESIYPVLEQIGNMPLPPYIHEKLADASRYQTVYARAEGSAAAPTAGLHFTPELLDSARRKGVQVVPVLLHVGLGTFRPVKEEDVDRDVMHSAFYQVTREAADALNGARRAGGRLICVGTTSVRTIETVADEDGIIHPGSGETSIFIKPGVRIKAVDALITNFHLPQSTLLMLVSTFMGREAALSAYELAVRERYRFFSFGDAMLILPTEPKDQKGNEDEYATAADV